MHPKYPNPKYSKSRNLFDMVVKKIGETTSDTLKALEMPSRPYDCGHLVVVDKGTGSREGQVNVSLRCYCFTDTNPMKEIFSAQMHIKFFSNVSDIHMIHTEHKKMNTPCIRAKQMSEIHGLASAVFFARPRSLRLDSPDTESWDLNFKPWLNPFKPGLNPV